MSVVPRFHHAPATQDADIAGLQILITLQNLITYTSL